MQHVGNEVKSKIVSNWVQSIAIVIAGIWGLYQFIYLEKIKPTREKPSLEIKIVMNRVGGLIPKNATNSLQAYRVIITTKNLGKAKAFVASSYLQIHADEIIKKPEDYELKRENIEEVVNFPNKLISKTYGTENSKLITAGVVYSSTTWFNPGQAITFERVFYVQEDDYSQIEANVLILSGPDTSGIYVKTKVDNELNFAWEVSDDEKKWHPIDTAEGRKIAGDRLTITRTNSYAPIVTMNKATVQ